MFDLKACTVCLKTNVKIYNLDSDQLRHEYNLVSGLKTHSQNGLPEYLCYQCMTYVRNFKKFRYKCQHSYYALREVFEREKKITESVIEELSHNVINIEPNLSYLALDHYRTKYEYIRSITEEQQKVNLEVYDTIPILQFSTTSDEVIFEVPKKKTKLWEELEDSIKQEDDSLIKHDETYVAELSELYEEKEDDCFDEFDDCETQNEFDNDLEKLDGQVEANGKNHEEEYATLIPINTKEAKAAVEVYKMLFQGKFACEICQKTYNSEYRLKTHMRMHDMCISGTFFCPLCKFYYRSELLLKSHVTEKHMYKYLCKKCPEVNFDRYSAKRHYYSGHFTEISQKDTHTIRLTKGRRKHKSAIRQVEPKTGHPKDYPILSAVTQEEQYALIRDRQKTNNYIDSRYKCEYCFKGFRVAITYKTHLKKHDSEISGKFQCDACKTYLTDKAKMYDHMTRCHLYKFTCQMCGYVCFNRHQAKIHYNWHKKVIYPCPHCKKEFSKNSTKLSHIRKMHPSTNICNLCGHSFIGVTGLHMHKLKTHSKEEVEENPGKVDPNNPLYCAECCVQFRDEEAFNTHLGSSNKHAETNRSIIKVTESAGRHDNGVVNMGRATSSNCGIEVEENPGKVDPNNPLYCAECCVQFRDEEAFNTHLGSSNKHAETNRSIIKVTESAGRHDNGVVNMGRAISSNCGICNKYLQNNKQATRHYDAEHPGVPYPKRYMCDICGHNTRLYANLVRHMRTHTQEKPYACPHCDRRFSMQNNRDRHIVVHTGEKPYQCPRCNRRFSQKHTIKLHIQTVHLKIPYPPWNKKNRKRRRDPDSASPSPHPDYKLDTT